MKVTNIMRASQVVGMKVLNAADDPVGTVKDMIIDHLHGKVSYVVIKLAGKKTTKLFPIPMPAFSYRPTEGTLILHVDRQTLDNAPGYEPDNLEWLADRGNGELIFSHYGYYPYWE